MEERSSHLTIVVGASVVAEDLRRSLVQHDLAHVGVATHLRGVRRSLVLGESDLVILCIALDQATLERHGDSLRQLLVDHECFPQKIRSVGLLGEIGLSSEVAQLGCDVYVHDSREAAAIVDSLARDWRGHRAATANAVQAEDRMVWSHGVPKTPLELAPIVGPLPVDSNIGAPTPDAARSSLDSA